MTLNSGPIDQAVLDDLWDFDDPVLSEKRLRQARMAAAGEDQQAELRTQEARALGLQGRYDEATELLDTVTSQNPVLETRLLLERGRLLNSAGQPEAAVPLFEDAVDRALGDGLTFLAIDALHMLALADPASAQRSTAEALALVADVDDARTKRWSVALHNNLGWALHEQQRYREALDEFEAAHAASKDYGTPDQEFVARWARARCLRSLGNNEAALAIQEQLALLRPDDSYVLEELEALRAAAPG